MHETTALRLRRALRVTEFDFPETEIPTSAGPVPFKEWLEHESARHESHGSTVRIVHNGGGRIALERVFAP